jgi:DNA-directed RNA polymerase subunit RPC12/RpoP
MKTNKRAAKKPAKEVTALEKCRNCGRQFNRVQAMTYSAYGYCSWDCLMNHRKGGNQAKGNGRKGQNRAVAGNRSRWA